MSIKSEEYENKNLKWFYIILIIFYFEIGKFVNEIIFFFI